MSTFFCDHIHLLCNDLDAMIAFWSKGFDAQFVESRAFGGSPGAVMELGITAKLFLKQVECEHADSGPSRAGMEHFGFFVPDLEAALENLLKLPNVSIAKAPFMSGTKRCCFIKGPEGILIEIMQQKAN